MLLGLWGVDVLVEEVEKVAFELEHAGVLRFDCLHLLAVGELGLTAAVCFLVLGLGYCVCVRCV